ncbi:MAG: hypothetical protein WA376_01355 [Terrimicrobiaceae bacterium]
MHERNARRDSYVNGDWRVTMAASVTWATRRPLWKVQRCLLLSTVFLLGRLDAVVVLPAASRE